jgi:hypothetical protein
LPFETPLEIRHDELVLIDAHNEIGQLYFSHRATSKAASTKTFFVLEDGIVWSIAALRQRYQFVGGGPRNAQSGGWDYAERMPIGDYAASALELFIVSGDAKKAFSKSPPN